MKIKAVLFDFIGTTVLEKGDIINQAFTNAFRQEGVFIDSKVLNQNRGKDKHEIINLILGEKYSSKEVLSEKIYRAFHANVEKSLSGFSLNAGVLEVLEFLKTKDISTGLGSALTRDLFEKIFDRLSWNKSSFQYIGIASEVGRNRPHPDMIFEMMKSVNVNADEFLKVGDTTTDILEGENAKVRTAAILSGTQPEELLRSAHPDFILNNLEELIDIIG
ncbi:MAG TPA: HAD family hydrolase [Cyclobacteriaceae bacterium]|nr:HAD family hydrolase [Cyclobacteriaceae bacterium]